MKNNTSALADNTSSVNVKSRIASLIKPYTMTIALVLVFIFFSFLTEGKLLYPQNLSNLLLQNAYVLVMACGMLLCILTGGNVDLSVGSILCLVGAVAAQMMSAFPNISFIVVILVCLAISVLIGIWQGFWIGYKHIPPFICTLAGMFLFRGLARVILSSKTINISNQGFLNVFTSYISLPFDKPDANNNITYWSAFIIGIIIAVGLVVYTVISRKKKAEKGYQLNSNVVAYAKIGIIAALILAYTWKLAHYKGIPVMLLWILLVLFLYAFITSKTAFGRYFYAVGGNEKATKLSGINTKKVYFAAYCSMSILAGFSGLLVAARIGSVNGDIGTSYEMDAIGSCFIGGASAYGGSGTVPGIVIGAILLGVINQGMSIYGLDGNWQYVVKGAVLLLAVIFDVLSNHKTGKAG